MPASTALAGEQRTAPVDSLIIPMDAERQERRNGIYQAYGFVYQFLQAGGTVRWAVSDSKNDISGVDFTVNGAVTLVNGVVDAPSGNPVSYSGGPFVIEGESNVQLALSMLSDPTWSLVSVHQAKAAFTYPAARLLRGSPTKLALLDVISSDGFSAGAEGIFGPYLRLAGIGSSAYDLLSPQAVNSGSLQSGGYSQLWVPHWGSGASDDDDDDDDGSPKDDDDDDDGSGTGINTAALAKIRLFLEAGNALLAECASIDVLENHAEARFLTTAGMAKNGGTNRVSDMAHPNPASPYAQIGDWPFHPETGSLRNFRPGAGSGSGDDDDDDDDDDGGSGGGSSAYVPGVKVLTTDYSGGSVGWDYFITGRLDNDPAKGSATYLAGHSYAADDGYECNTVRIEFQLKCSSGDDDDDDGGSSSPGYWEEPENDFAFTVHYENGSTAVIPSIRGYIDNPGVFYDQPNKVVYDFTRVQVTPNGIKNIQARNLGTGVVKPDKIEMTWADGCWKLDSLRFGGKYSVGGGDDDDDDDDGGSGSANSRNLGSSSELCAFKQPDKDTHTAGIRYVLNSLFELGQSLGLTVAITEPAEGLRTADPQVTVRGTVARSTAVVTVNGVAAVVTGNTWEAVVPLTEEGPITLTATATLGDNSVQSAVNIIRDVSGPALSLTATSDPVIMGEQLNIVWSAEDETTPVTAALTVNDEPFSSDLTGDAFYTPAIDPDLSQLVIKLDAADGLGNESRAVVNVAVNPPFLGITLDDPLNDTRTDAPSITISGTITFKEANVTVNGIPAAQNGTFWSAEVPLTQEGDNTITAIATFGVAPPAQAQVNVIRDTTGPVLSLDAAPNPVVMGEELTVTWSSVDGSGPIVGSVTRDGQPFSDQPDGTQSYLVPFDADLSQIGFVLTAIDGFGNESSIPLTVAVNPPTLSVGIDSPPNGFRTDQNSVTVTGAMSHEVASVSVNGVPAVQTGLNWTAEVPLPTEGDHVLTATATFGTATPATAQVVVTRDNTGPVLSLTATPDPVVMGQDILVTWSSTDDSVPVSGSVTRDSQPFSDQASGSQSYIVPFDAALTRITFDLTSQDAFGNSNSAQTVVAVNPPTLSIAVDNPGDGFRTDLDSVTVSGVVSHEVATVTVNGVPAIQTGTNWVADVPLPTEGDHVIVATATFGTAVPATAQITVTRDNTGPVLSLGATPDPVVMGQALTVTWSSADESGPIVGSVTRDGLPFSDQPDGTQIYTVPFEATLTQIGFQLTAVDGFGNESTTPLTVAVNPPTLGVAIYTPADGFRTNLDTVTVTGTMSHEVASVTVNGVTATQTGTNWTAEVPLPTEGDHVITATAGFSTATPATAQITVTRDNTGPVLNIAATPDPVVMGQDILVTWSSTDDSTPVSGSVTRDGQPFSDQASGSQTYTVPFDAALTQIAFDLTSQDAFGNSNTAQAVAAVNPPTLGVAIDTPADGFRTNLDTVTITGTMSHEVVTVTVNGVGATQTGTSWTADVPLPTEGDHVIIATAGFSTATPATAQITVTRDNTGPVLSLGATPDPVVMGQELTVTWSSSDESGPIVGSITRDGQPFSDQPDGTQSYIVPFDAGLTQIGFEFTAIDGFGNESSTPLTVAVNPPTIGVAIDTPADGFRTNLDTVTLTGTMSHEVATVSVNGVAATQTGTNWTADVPLPTEGDYVIIATATFSTATPATAQITVTRDNTGPVLSITATPNPVVMGQDILVTWSSADDSTPVSGSVTRDGQPFSDQASGSQSYTVPFDAVLTQITFDLMSQDAFGNSNTAQAVVAVNPPTIGVAIDTPADGFRTNLDTVTVTGTMSHEVATVTVNGVTATQTGTNWTADVPLPTEGDHVIIATTTFSTATPGTAQITVTRDNTGPVLSITA
ncbi:MAG: hypothetical protein QNK37_25850, partial [Acidobacteriota bacterium]|nr:hypothetical protein [Acidobacteriota bacterium]